jgi:hypothetical protein
VADGYDRSTAELDPAAKDAISHRGRAIAAIVPVLVAELRRLHADVAGRPETVDPRDIA